MRGKARVLLAVLLVVTVVASLAAVSGCKKEPEERVLVIGTWGGDVGALFDAYFGQPFCQQYNCTIQYSYGGAEEQYEKLKAQKANPELDLVTFSPSNAILAGREGLVEDLTRFSGEIPNYADIYDWAKNDYCVGIWAYPLSLAYRSDKITDPIDSWQALLDPKYKGRVGYPVPRYGGGWPIVNLALVGGGDESNIDAAFDILPALRDNVLTFYGSDSENYDNLTRGEFWVSLLAQPDYLRLAGNGVPLQFVLPKEGFYMGTDVIAMVKDGPHSSELAAQFVNFILSPALQAEGAKVTYTSPTNRKTVLPDEIAAVVVYGPEETSMVRKVDWAIVSDNLNVWLQRWDQIVLAP